jgi:protein-S-isoprenylcysteine O-methyltransferase Ste14
MIGMRYAVDLAFLDEMHRVVHTVASLAPGRISPRVAHAESVLELPVGTLGRIGLAEGAQVAFTGEGPAPERDLASACLNVALAGLYVFFASAHASFVLRTGQWASTLPIVLQETLLVALFLMRRRPYATSTRPFDWAIGIAGALLPLCMRAVEPLGPLAWLGRPVQMAALLFSLAAIGTLGRSWGVIAANRGVKTAGPYGFVRHPVYASHLASYAGFVACYPTLLNILLAIIITAALDARARAEERFLAADATYRAYRDRVRWRFLPFVY